MSEASFLCAHAAHVRWREALAECQRQLEMQAAVRRARDGTAAPLTLGWCYLGEDYAEAAEAILAELKEDWPGVAWVGADGVGVCANGVEYIDEPALVLMLAPLPSQSFRLFSGRRPLPGPTSGFSAHTAQVHADGGTPDLQDLLRELSARTATGYLFGGVASARRRPLHVADDVLGGGLSGVLFNADVELVARVTQGCQPIGPSRTVTRAERNLLIALDGRPALDCVLQDLGLARDAPLELLSEALSGTLAGLGGGVEQAPHQPGTFGTDTLVRHVIGVDVLHRVLALADVAEPGVPLAFCRRNPDAALADLVRMAGEVRAELGRRGAGRAAGAVYVSCCGRGGPHFGAPNAELQALRGVLGELPLAGFFAGGEIARDHLYGYTGVLTVFVAH
ncbi:hypothetical protein BKK79_19620 [Cupriavidus sp. USMAA2-4]|uniref:Small ligand-binding sensory domain FIST n=1 Tax=Cupriavidus malaysiensis TaxID=367825 RepID=A0ABM6F507_9BURK|nr:MULTISPECIES: FIST N-terminal domain-containing protein [Cupriavidus]AOY93760.1 hypothetical protein BKK79_19620 [Cupriavidus sp. USMAA2-4]AOY99950.1 hypothetical protein BKK81_12370 [Cupriavidus sp. USMAHM13]AOZ06577.1 hypothetical protein BKK80_12680 [Cupriavidus malaysiensis]